MSFLLLCVCLQFQCHRQMFFCFLSSFFFLLHSTLTVFLTPTSVFHKNSVFFFLFTPRVYVYFVWLLTVIRSPLFLFISFSVEEQWMIKADFFCLLFSCCIIYCVRFSFSFFSRFECFFFLIS